jgi:hypothetical protein
MAAFNFEKLYTNARFAVFTEVKIQVDVFWVVTPCIDVAG